ncbi:hypothetical protein HanIR_Chr04g0175171 [Helianthus annuus]|nr:hypothetical protein HanIR_Chr04g0175171 [Helianthus annuus]
MAHFGNMRSCINMVSAEVLKATCPTRNKCTYICLFLKRSKCGHDRFGVGPLSRFILQTS